MAEFDFQPPDPVDGPDAVTHGAPDWLRSLLDEAAGPDSSDADRRFDRLAQPSRAFAWHESMMERSAAEDVSEPAPLAPAGRAMLGWTDQRPDPDDAFAARLMAAFQSGALDVKPRMSSHDAVPPASRRQEPAAENPAKTFTGRGGHRVEPKYQTYPVLGVAARPFPFPW